MLNWIARNRTVLTSKMRTNAKLNYLKKTFLTFNSVYMLYSHLHITTTQHQRQMHEGQRRKKGRRKENASRITQEQLRCRKEDTGRNDRKTSLTKYIPLTLFVRFAFERMLETERKLYILTPLLWPSRCVLFSWCWGPLHQGFPRTPRSGVAFPTTPGL